MKGACIGPGMLKVKDWPPTDDFAKEMPRHFMVSVAVHQVPGGLLHLLTSRAV